MSDNAILSLILFLVVYALIISERIHRTVIALFGAVVAIVLGLISQKAALTHIDFNTLGLLFGMMIIVNITGRTGLFNFLAIYVAKKVKARPLELMLALSTLTMVASAFLDNVTTVFLMVPVIFSITNQLRVDVRPYLIAQILASNIGGACTLIGDPPNIMVGTVASFDFMDFILNLAPVGILVYIVNMFMITVLYLKSYKTSDMLRQRIMRLNEKKEIVDITLLKKCLGCLSLVIVLFMVHSLLHIETATAALLGATILLLLCYADNEDELARVFSELEWLSIFFFMGLFILVGMLVENGLIKILAEKAMAFTKGDVKNTTILVLWMSAIASAFVDNIPFVATLLPLIEELGTMGVSNLKPIYWALALGACLGGIGTLIGSSANVVVASMAAQRGKPILFVKYMIIALPLMLLSIGISHIYILYKYF